jgi:hypothetical protein
MFTVTPLGFATATAVVESVSFQLSVLHVEAALEKGATGSILMAIAPITCSIR